MTTERKDRLEVNELKARRIVVESGNGLHKLELVGGPDGVGLWAENTDTKSAVSIESNNDRLHVGIFGRDGMKIGFTLVEGRPTLSVLMPDGTCSSLDAEDFESLRMMTTKEKCCR